MLLDEQYDARSWLHLLFHQLLECLVILTGFEYLNQAWSTMSVNFKTTSSNSSIFEIVEASIYEKDVAISLTKLASSLLFLAIVCLLFSTCSSTMGIVTVKRAWSDEQHQSGWIQWVFISEELLPKNIKSITEFDSLGLSKYLVGTGSGE